jgi:hypothetical protein
MSNRNVLLVGAAAIAIFVAAGLLLVGRTDVPATGAGARTEANGAAAPEAARAPDAAAASDTAGAPGSGPAVPVSTTSAPAPLPDIVPARPHRPASAAAFVEWESVPMVARIGQLGPDVSGPVMRGLAAARAQMDTCFTDEARRLARGEGPRFDPADPPTGPAVLMLMLQSRPGGVDVVDTQVVSLGTSTAALTSCVQQALKGWPMNAPGATGARRYRLRYVVQ